MSREYSIKQASDMLNISTNKIRFYEKKGLIKSKRNINNNYRYFEEEDLLKIEVILMYRTLDISLEDIKDIMKNNYEDNVLDHFYKQWQIINDKIHNMRLIKDCLQEIMDNIYEKRDKNYIKSIMGCTKKMSDTKKITTSWKDKWDFDNWANTYDECIQKDNTKGKIPIYINYDKVLEEVYDNAIKNKNSDVKVLDIGVGTGNLSKKFLVQRYNIIGIDQSREMLNVAKRKLPNLKVRLGEFLKIPFENNTFDIIVSTYAFHHLNDEEKKAAFKEMFRVLNNDGIIVLGDLMFKSKTDKEKVLSEFTQEQIEEVEDEYYSNIELLKTEVNKYNKKLKYKRIDILNFMVKVC
ncbi:methyltransferase domain-containing protein [Haloimpatiens sp. FM7330]|uniref:MerR family transcriptional regulator n=1 Tax=Haloimpatiens sp. FM7330 TaxID=3298610 RepID=UPI0036364AD8